MNFLGKMYLNIILTVKKKKGFTLSLEDTRKNRNGGGVNNIRVNNITFSYVSKYMENLSDKFSKNKYFL